MLTARYTPLPADRLGMSIIVDGDERVICVRDDGTLYVKGWAERLKGEPKEGEMPDQAKKELTPPVKRGPHGSVSG